MRHNVSIHSTDDDSDIEELQHKTGDYLTKSASLPKGVLQIKQCTDLNKDSPLKVVLAQGYHFPL